MAVWSTPDVLVLHLKRFEYRNVFVRDKLNTFVDFPLSGLDMSDFARYSQRQFLRCGGAPPTPGAVVYDLYGVVNHMGGMAGGHYTAYTNSAVGRGFTDPRGEYWHEFNDSTVSRVPPQAVVTRYAYVLFYRRRKESSGPVPSAVPPPSSL